MSGSPLAHPVYFKFDTESIRDMWLEHIDEGIDGCTKMPVQSKLVLGRAVPCRWVNTSYNLGNLCESMGHWQYDVIDIDGTFPLKGEQTMFKFTPFKTDDGEYEVIDTKYHRNGVSGEGFMAGLFKSLEGDTRGLTFIFTMYPSFSGWKEGKEYEEPDEYTYEESCGSYKCSVLCLTHINKYNDVQSAWRGDVMYHEVVQAAIRGYNQQMDDYYK
jgi:hypothetical protein